MTVSTLVQPPFIVDTASEIDMTWPNNAMVFVKDIGKMYQIIDGVAAPMNLLKRSQSSVLRYLDGDGYQVSDIHDSFVYYNVQIASVLNLVGGTKGSIFLEISPDGSTGWNEVGRFVNGNSGTLTLALTTTNTQGGVIRGFVPAGYYARLRTVTGAGSPVYTYLSGQEILV